MKKLLFTMASLVMLASASFAQEEPTPMLPSQHGLTDHQPAWGSSQTFNLAEGWNWWSTYINGKTIVDLENALGTDGLQIKSSASFTSYNGTSWEGLLSGDLDISKMYAIQMSAVPEEPVKLQGSRAAADQVAITGSAGWNWVGYPVNYVSSVAYALADYQAAEGDVFKGVGGFVTYLGTTWEGTLTQLEPGVGYKLSTGADFTFNFPTTPDPSITRNVITQNVTSTEWQPEMASIPTNMNMIAVVNLNGEELRSDNVEIGVFNGETCRGAICPKYVESLDRYVVFLTMYGEENEPFSFRLLDHETGDVYESTEASVSYKSDNVIGKLRSPFELKFNTKNMVANNLHLFPNPVNHGEMVNMILPEGTVTIEVVNVMGSTVKSIRTAQGSELSVDMAPGIYTVKVTDGEGHVYVDKLIVK